MTGDATIQDKVKNRDISHVQMRDICDKAEDLVKVSIKEKSSPEERDAAKAELKDLYDEQVKALKEHGRGGFLDNPGFKADQKYHGPDVDMESAVKVLAFFRTLPVSEANNPSYPGLDREQHKDSYTTGWPIQGGIIRDTLDKVRDTVAYEEFAASDNAVLLKHPAVKLLDQIRTNPELSDYVSSNDYGYEMCDLYEYLKGIPVSEANNPVFPGYQPSTDNNKPGSFLDPKNVPYFEETIPSALAAAQALALKTYKGEGNDMPDLGEVKLPEEAIKGKTQVTRNLISLRKSKGTEAAADLKSDIVVNNTINPAKFAEVMGSSIEALKEAIAPLNSLKKLVARATGEKDDKPIEPPDLSSEFIQKDNYRYDVDINIDDLAKANGWTDEQTLKFKEGSVSMLSMATVFFEGEKFLDTPGSMLWVVGKVVAGAAKGLDEDDIFDEKTGLNKEVVSGAPGISDEKLDFINANILSFSDISLIQEASEQGIPLTKYRQYQDDPDALLQRYVAEQNDTAVPEPVAPSRKDDILGLSRFGLTVPPDEIDFSFRIPVLEDLTVERTGISQGIWTDNQRSGLRFSMNNTGDGEVNWRHHVDDLGNLDFGLLAMRAGDFNWGFHSDVPGLERHYDDTSGLVGGRLTTLPIRVGPSELRIYGLGAVDRDGDPAFQAGTVLQSPTEELGWSYRLGAEGTFKDSGNRADVFGAVRNDFEWLDGAPGSVEGGGQATFGLDDKRVEDLATLFLRASSGLGDKDSLLYNVRPNLGVHGNTNGNFGAHTGLDVVLSDSLSLGASYQYNTRDDPNNPFAREGSNVFFQYKVEF